MTCGSEVKRTRNARCSALIVAASLAILGAASACSNGGGGTGGSTTTTSGAGGESLGPVPTSCNGHPELCGRKVTEVSFAGTHGSYSNIDEGFGAPDQTHDVARQLSDGIRVIHLEVHVDHDQVVVCHSLCALGERPLVHDLGAVASFLEAHPDNVVTVLLERSDPFITADQIGDAFDTTGLSALAHVQKLGDAWPTLSDLIRHHTQVIALLDDPSGSHHDFLMPRWDFTWETPWDNEKPADFGRCGADRGKLGSDFYVVDTYLEDQTIPTAAHAKLVNVDPFFVDRVLFCKDTEKARPNFVMVNFYEESDVFHVVDILNGFIAAPTVDLADFPPPSFSDAPDGGTDAG
jgi:hypothetical protein